MNASDDLVLETPCWYPRSSANGLGCLRRIGENDARAPTSNGPGLLVLTGRFHLWCLGKKWNALAGFAAGTWVIDLLEWISSLGVDSRCHHQVMGLLLGYSAKSIAEHIDIVFGGEVVESGYAS